MVQLGDVFLKDGGKISKQCPVDIVTLASGIISIQQTPVTLPTVRCLFVAFQTVLHVRARAGDLPRGSHHHIQPVFHVVCPVPDANDDIHCIEWVNNRPAGQDCPDISAAGANEGPGWSPATEGVTCCSAALSTQWADSHASRQDRGSVISDSCLRQQHTAATFRDISGGSVMAELLLRRPRNRHVPSPTWTSRSSAHGFVCLLLLVQCYY